MSRYQLFEELCAAMAWPASASRFEVLAVSSDLRGRAGIEEGILASFYINTVCGRPAAWQDALSAFKTWQFHKGDCNCKAPVSVPATLTPLGAAGTLLGGQALEERLLTQHL